MNKFLHAVGDALFGTTRNSFNPAALTGPNHPIDSEFTLTDPSHFHPRDEHGIPMNRDSTGGLTYFPTRVASCAFAHFNRHIEQGDATSHEFFFRMAAWFMGAGDGIWRYHCDYTFADGTLKSPWISAMAQGQGISVLTPALTS